MGDECSRGKLQAARGGSRKTGDVKGEMRAKSLHERFWLLRFTFHVFNPLPGSILNQRRPPRMAMAAATPNETGQPQ